MDAGKFCFPHVESLLDKVVNNGKFACVEHCPFTFRPVSMLPAISSLVKITLANSVPKCTGLAIWGFVSIP